MKRINIFLSYCWADTAMANEIYEHFKNNHDIELHKDTIDIGTWQSIKVYMQSIEDMDYVILLISDSYLKSANCMYEVLEVMRDRKYREKVFPVVVNPEIYDPFSRVGYVKYWEDKFKEFRVKIGEIEAQNQGPLTGDLKRYQDIASNMAEFLETVSDMNNPSIPDVKSKIEEILKNSGYIKIENKSSNLFKQLGLLDNKSLREPTDLDINQFVIDSYDEIVEILGELCEECADKDRNIQVQIEKVDTRTVIFRFYINGRLVRGLKIFLGNIFRSRETIGVADVTMSFGSGNNSWNGMYEAKTSNGELRFYATMSMGNRDHAMTPQEVVADIWKNYIQEYLKR